MKLKKKIAYNAAGGGTISRTIKANYWKVSLSNFLHTDGLAATCILEIYETNLQDRP